MFKKFRRKFRKLRHYQTAIDGFEFYRCLLDQWLKQERVRLIVVRGYPVYVRSNTPDIKVAISSLFEREYDHIHHPNAQFIIDAGANIGTSAVFFANKYPKATIIAIEPEQHNFELLVNNTQHYDNVHCIKGAIWGLSCKRTIKALLSGHWKAYTVSETDNRTLTTDQQADCITIESIMEQFNIETISLLKMDIEGGEKHVLENASNWIDAVDIMTVELHDKMSMGCGRAFYLATTNFKVFEKRGEKITAYKNPLHSRVSGPSSQLRIKT